MPPVRTVVIASSGRNKGLTRALSIVNPILNSNGIYDILDDEGNTFQAYVDMTVDGGYWILVSRWTGYIPSSTPANKVTFRESIAKNEAIAGYSMIPATYPAIPAGRIAKNPAKEWLFSSGNPSWISLFGNWQKGQILEGPILHGVGVPVVTSIGNRTLHGHRTGWLQDTTLDYGIGWWTVAGNNGHCGGQAKVGTNKCCPVMAYDTEGYSAHSDASYTKQVFLRATNFPSN